MIAMSMSDENMRYRLITHGIEERADVSRIVGAGVDDRDFPMAEDVAHGSLESEWARVVGHDPPHARHGLVHHVPCELEIFVEGNIVAHVPSEFTCGNRPTTISAILAP